MSSSFFLCFSNVFLNEDLLQFEETNTKEKLKKQTLEEMSLMNIA
jgi:hypothetical protein